MNEFQSFLAEYGSETTYLLSVCLFFFWAYTRRLKRERNEAEKRRQSLVDRHEQDLKNLKKEFSKYKPIVDIEEEVARLQCEYDQVRADLTDEKRQLAEKIAQLKMSYKDKRASYDALVKEVAIYDEKVAFAELGVYEPHFDFGDSAVYKEEIKRVRGLQKDMVSAKQATLCPADWSVDGSRSKGQTMVNRQVRLTMRAFNNECEAAIGNARWNNVVAMEKRILNAAKQIDSANTSMQLRLNEAYVALKLDELHLTHEYRERLKVEKDERAEVARAEREEKKLLAEAAASEKREAEYQALLTKARSEVGIDERRIEELEAKLAEAHEATERARAMAEVTKSGYVYIISNIGSFGEDVVKIGLTRRLDPDDRVKELGDASVPFQFDTHAMIYSQEAPALEKALHDEFSDRRINMSNMRKEFFRVQLDEVERAVRRLAPTAEFFTDREAQEWHETLSRRREALTAMAKGEVCDLPLEI